MAMNGWICFESLLAYLPLVHAPLQSGLFWPGQKTMPMRPKRVGILHPAWLQGSLRMGMPVVRRPVRVDNDGSALGLARESFLSVPFMSQSNYLNSWRKGQRVW
ncbi:uncharacterized protein LOC26535055 isoform X2 [Drosophila yakuba]|uniref:Uncharacterized protein, isoform A n=1 Tax=Drosophila yakuba TaxID=7245 RepID=A0A0R1DVA9_DROYA|nr:uncharacterized protein LOC26535055 isoform X2 [Drosophila yakuba]KRJ98678.1 uncharacterized protein Dyak_GE27874, isoform A [Drosophila yakuba]